MFQYWFIDLYCMFPNYETDKYGMSEYTDSIWKTLFKSNYKKMEYAHILYTFHSIFTSKELI